MDTARADLCLTQWDWSLVDCCSQEARTGSMQFFTKDADQ